MLFFGVAVAFIVTDVFIYTRLVFGSSLRQIFPVVLQAGGPEGIWGLSWLAKTISWETPAPLVIFGILLLLGQIVILWRAKQLGWSIWQSFLFATLFIYAILMQWGVQYLFWLLPWLFMTYQEQNSQLRNWFWILASGYVFMTYFNISLSPALIFPESIIISWGAVLWLLLIIWWTRGVMIKPTLRLNAVTP